MSRERAKATGPDCTETCGGARKHLVPRDGGRKWKLRGTEFYVYFCPWCGAQLNSPEREVRRVP